MISVAHALKLFLPSWSFFDDFSVTARIEIRVRCEAGTMDEWRLMFPATSTRSFKRVFFNATGNAELFKLAVIENVADLLKGKTEAERRMFEGSADGRRLARWGSESAGVPEGEVQYRLRLTTSRNDPEEWFVSQWTPVD